MKSITIHKLDESTSRLLEERAAREGTNMNECVKNILRAALGVDAPQETDWTSMLSKYAGVWSDAERMEFEKNTSRLGEVDDDLWR